MTTVCSSFFLLRVKILNLVWCFLLSLTLKIGRTDQSCCCNLKLGEHRTWEMIKLVGEKGAKKEKADREKKKKSIAKLVLVGSGCSSVGRVVASDTRDPRFESRHWQNFYRTFVYCHLCWKDKNKEKRGREWPIVSFFLFKQFFL